MAIINIGAGQAPTDQDDAITGTARNDTVAARAGNDLSASAQVMWDARR